MLRFFEKPFSLFSLLFFLVPAFFLHFLLASHPLFCHVYTLIPLLVFSYYFFSFSACLLFSLGCGLFIDLLSIQMQVGSHSFVFFITTCFLYEQKKRFFSEKITTIPLLTFLFSSLSTFVLFCFSRLLYSSFRISFQSLLTDVFLLPLLDALFAFLFFVFPLRQIQRVGKKYMGRRRKRMQEEEEESEDDPEKGITS